MSTARRWLDRIELTTVRAGLEFVDDRGHRDAAQIAFFALLSFVPLALLLVGAFGLGFDDAEVRERVITTVFDNVPLARESDRAQLERTVGNALEGAGRLGPASILLLLAAASGVMGALRHAINEAWDIHTRPPLLRRKLLDLALVLGGTVVLALSLSLTATRRLADAFDEDENGRSLVSGLLDGLGDMLPIVFTGLVVLFLYRVLPAPRPKTREIWPGAVVAALLLGLVREALDFYFEELSDFGALYGSLGALMALLVFGFAAANVLVFGAEFASEWSRLPPTAETREIVARGHARIRTGFTHVLKR
ncbi:MAG TPA: YihY/virulence factor BrkB family protein [Solirubrobacteraceae bacterium]|nr:YihY/virulence factor BrkB family protein [Solirubrobacteraceae bacterium]